MAMMVNVGFSKAPTDDLVSQVTRYGFYLLFRDAVSVFYIHSQLGYKFLNAVFLVNTRANNGNKVSKVGDHSRG